MFRRCGSCFSFLLLLTLAAMAGWPGKPATSPGCASRYVLLQCCVCLGMPVAVRQLHCKLRKLTSWTDPRLVRRGLRFPDVGRCLHIRAPGKDSFCAERGHVCLLPDFR